MKYAALIALFFVAACGADGEPVQPSANLAIGVGESGVSAGARLGLSKGPISIHLGL